ncbi:hypothetical protein [Caballeronia sp. DA-9]|uniref:hypothetical protein n=1 Tax=Caballeronia sp. DA-9 TaxID=3436237 RepID=UPI003F673241
MLTDIESGWTIRVAMRVCNQMLLIEKFEKAAADLLFAIIGVDLDNDRAFMTQSVLELCKGRNLATAIEGIQGERLGLGGAEERRSFAATIGYGLLSGVEARNPLAQPYASSRIR